MTRPERTTCQFEGCGDPLIWMGDRWNHCTERDPKVPDHRPVPPAEMANQPQWTSILDNRSIHKEDNGHS